MIAPERRKAISTEAGFRLEQDKLGHVWTYLGLARDLPEKNDWFRTHLGGREIFVQNFGDDIRAYENRCAHRGYPLRNAERGNGPVLCGFHHWRYDQTGLAYGIPECEAYFGARPKQLGLRLTEVEIGLCGGLIFGRFPGPDQPDQPGLRDWLGELFEVFEGLAEVAVKPHTYTRATQSHWLLNMEITLDDYHSVAVHPESFGRDGYLGRDSLQYYRLGEAHSAFILQPPDARSRPTDGIAGFFATSGGAYRIFQVFPNLLVMQMTAITLAGEPFGYALIQSFTPLAHDRTLGTTRHAALAGAGPASVLRRLLQPAVDIGFRFNLARVHGQDFAINEALQRNAARLPAGPLAVAEERIGWFRETYDNFTGGASASP
jgi:phenylpropionate dioxygenase-like ring-hydroxylating dioxygenase large terminal subunit